MSSIGQKAVHSPSFSFQPVTLKGQLHLIVLFASPATLCPLTQISTTWSSSDLPTET